MPAIAIALKGEAGRRVRRGLLLAALVVAPGATSLAGPIAEGEIAASQAAAAPPIAAPAQPRLSFIPGNAAAVDLGVTRLDPAARPVEPGPTLRDVLHRMVNLRHRARPAASHRSAADPEHAPAAEEDGEDAASPADAESPAEALRKLVLDSEVLGGILGRVVSTHVAEDGSKSFDVLGHGRFSVDVGAESGDIVMREARSGASLDLQGASREERERAREAAREDSLRLSRLIDAVHAFLVSGEGIAMMIVAALGIALWGVFRLASRLGRRARARPWSPQRARRRHRIRPAPARARLGSGEAR